MNSLKVLCCWCSQSLNSSLDTYMIIKCGHVFHEACLKEFTYRKTCPSCYVQFDPRQCRKICMFEEFEDTSNRFLEPLYRYDWMYCDQKTIVERKEFNQFGFKLGMDADKNDIYAARVFVNGNTLPAYYMPRRKVAIATMNGRVLELIEDIDILDISSDNKEFYKWQTFENLCVPKNAFDITHLPDEKQYIVRHVRGEKTIYGKLCSADNGQKNRIFLINGNEEIEIEERDAVNIEVFVREAI